MKEKTKSEGKCLFCSKTFAKAGINRHLTKHLEEKILEAKPGKSFLLKVESNPYYGSTGHFLSLWIDGETKMKNLDTFLRDIWLECCGHLSAFADPVKRRQRTGGWDYFEAQELLEQGKITEYEKLMEDAKGEIPMSRKAKDVLYKDFKIEYEYDFGSTTALLITVLHEYPIKADKKIVLVSRNEPLPILCGECGKEPATEVCIAHSWEENSLFCDKCAKKHSKKCSDFEDYAAMPVINSPRFGTCGYMGGIMDTERDGVYVKQ